MKHFLLIAAVVLLTAAAHAQTTPALEQARVALARGDNAAAERLLGEVNPSAVDLNDLDFLRGTLAVRTGRYRDAAEYFAGILARDPGLNRVRLELARARFLAGDDAEAERQFRAAIAAGVPLAVARNVAGFLGELRRRRHYDLDFGFGVAADSNVNVATTAQSVDLFGLPFQIDQTARKRSGTGLALNASGNYQWDIAADTRLKVGGVLYDAEYKDGDFADRQAFVYAGPRFMFADNSEVSVFATGAHRWYGGKNMTEAYGLRLEGEQPLGRRFLLNGAVSWQNQTYLRSQFSAYSGPVYQANAVLSYAQPAGFLRGTLGVVRENARIPALRGWQFIAGAGIYRHTLPMRFSAYLSTQVVLARYDDRLGAFGVTRRDEQVDIRLSLSNANLTLGRFTPIISYVHTERFSNIPIYAYSRDRFEVGFNWTF
jgi:hypothetical protein